MKYYTYDQNNSGGSFDFDDKAGISTKVIIQADDPKHADYRAQRIGLYFDGSGDCSCCGDRWSAQDYGWGAHDSGTDEPEIYTGVGIQDWMTSEWFMKWMGPDRPEVYVHLADGRFAGFVYGDPRDGTLRMTENLEIES